MRDTKSWMPRAEEYCRAKGVDKTVHPTKKYLYDLHGVGDEVTLALFDSDGFLLIRRGDLPSAWGDGYFPSGIKVHDGYLTRAGFEKLETPGGRVPES
jgi:hypothetical protein